MVEERKVALTPKRKEILEMRRTRTGRKEGEDKREKQIRWKVNSQKKHADMAISVPRQITAEKRAMEKATRRGKGTARLC